MRDRCAVIYCKTRDGKSTNREKDREKQKGSEPHNSHSESVNYVPGPNCQPCSRTVPSWKEVEMPSARAVEDRTYLDLGLTDAAIAAVAREHKCAVLTDYLDLYLLLIHEYPKVFNFTHLRERVWGV